MNKCDKESHVCYCNSSHEDDTLSCSVCKSVFHLGCLKTGRPTTLKGDTFFSFTCSHCAGDGEEICERLKLQWVHVVALALYNLQSCESGKFGYFRWKEQICSFIDKHWECFFGASKKKTQLWYGTVAGALSNGCPGVFTSGLEELNENGWWRLTDFKPPSLELSQIYRYKKVKVEQSHDELDKSGGLRFRKGKTSIQAAIELKARRSNIEDRREVHKRTTNDTNVTHEADYNPADVDVADDSRSESAIITYEDVADDKSATIESGHPIETSGSIAITDGVTSSTLPRHSFKVETDGDESGLRDCPSSIDDFAYEGIDEDVIKTELMDDCEYNGDLGQFLAEMADDDDSCCDVDIDPGQMSPPSISCTSLSVQELVESVAPNPHTIGDLANRADDSPFNSILSQSLTVGKADSALSSEDCADSDKDGNEPDGCESIEKLPIRQRKRKYYERDLVGFNESSMSRISLYEENKLLQRLDEIRESLHPDMRRFRRKLIVRQEKRVHNLPVFDLNRWITPNRVVDSDPWEKQTSSVHSNVYNIPLSHMRLSDQHILDRYQVSKPTVDDDHMSFRMRLIGREDRELKPIRSPYTTRVLKPFIRRDRETRPLKLSLLEEVIAYHHRHDPCWKPPEHSPVDFCYVRPEHIPSVNSLCRQFFWPGIDLSECLRYPDFSCVVLYRKIVIAFAFMVPDLAEAHHNEAYVSFIFTHPEWRRAGIASFMLYHLIQTCMGKDLTLHVAATNPAMMLYQKFGFKPEEYIIGFYDKYYPNTSSECLNAFFLRLRR